MLLEIINPDITIYSGEVSLVQMPGTDGLFEVLDKHAPMIAALEPGKIKADTVKNGIMYFDIPGGVVEVLNNKVLVLSN